MHGDWLAAALEELDYGIVMVVEGSRILHMNGVARQEMDDRHPLRCHAGVLRARHACDAAPLGNALADAAGPGLRRMLTVGTSAQRETVSIVPLDLPSTSERPLRAVLVVFSKLSVCESLSVEAFARNHGLTQAETRVLVALCNGAKPAKAASQLGVAISTVRTQIGSIRAKTGAASMFALARQVALLPPIRGALRPRAPMLYPDPVIAAD